MFIEEYLTEGVFLCSSEINTDNRGQFMELYNNEVLKKFGVSSFIQQNLVKSSKFVIRGMHWQSQPFEQAKFITVISGKILDVFIDLRFESKTYKKIYALQLNSNDAHSIFIPTGFAHGYQSLEDDTVVCYSVTNIYAPKYEKRINPLSGQLIKFWQKPYLVGNLDESAENFI